MLNLDEAITHAFESGNAMLNKNKCDECGKEHIQLGEWLKELRDLRKENKRLKNEIDSLNNHIDCLIGY